MLNTRLVPVLVVSLAINGCQPPAQRGDSGAPTSGQTTVARGTPNVVVSETSRARGDTTSDAPAGGATLSLDRTAYAAGAQVGLRVTSQTTDTLGFNPCTRSLERRDAGGAWVTHTEPDRVCTMELWLLEANQTRSATTELPASLAPGSYRMVLLLSRQRPPPPGAPRDWGTVRAASSAFRVE